MKGAQRQQFTVYGNVMILMNFHLCFEFLKASNQRVVKDFSPHTQAHTHAHTHIDTASESKKKNTCVSSIHYAYSLCNEQTLAVTWLPVCVLRWESGRPQAMCDLRVEW